jgi:hypothetical protein
LNLYYRDLEASEFDGIWHVGHNYTYLLFELEFNYFGFTRIFFGSTLRLNLNLIRFRFICLRIDYPLDLVLD